MSADDHLRAAINALAPTADAAAKEAAFVAFRAYVLQAAAGQAMHAANVAAGWPQGHPTAGPCGGSRRGGSE